MKMTAIGRIRDIPKWAHRGGFDRLSPAERREVVDGYRIAVETFGRPRSKEEAAAQVRDLLSATVFHSVSKKLVISPSIPRKKTPDFRRRLSKAVFSPRGKFGPGGTASSSGRIRLYDFTAPTAAHEGAHIILRNYLGEHEFRPLATAIDELVSYQRDEFFSYLPYELYLKNSVVRNPSKYAIQHSSETGKKRKAYAVGRGIALDAIEILEELGENGRYAPYNLAYKYVGYLAKGQSPAQARISVFWDFVKAFPDSPKVREYVLPEVERSSKLLAAVDRELKRKH
ncbi:Uncharacterised protein [Candidatus Norongarragalina meridionalis]|nr:Uncharacterised protein [Candidatus Norongarragalina meridionalis]